MYDLKARRQELGLTMLEVANAVGVSEATVSRYESGNIKNMRRDRIEKYAKVLRINPALLIGAEQDDQKPESDQPPEELVILNRKARNWSPEKRKQLLDMARVMFKEDFND